MKEISDEEYKLLEMYRKQKEAHKVFSRKRLIRTKLLIAKARQKGIDVSDKEVEEEYRKRYGGK